MSRAIASLLLLLSHPAQAQLRPDTWLPREPIFPYPKREQVQEPPPRTIYRLQPPGGTFSLLLEPVARNPASRRPNPAPTPQAPDEAQDPKGESHPVPLTGPVDCYTQARRQTFLSEEQSARLCRCARTAYNVDCFRQAKARTFLDDEGIIKLCAGLRTELECLQAR